MALCLILFIVLASVTSEGHESRKVAMQPFGNQIFVEYEKHADPFGQETEKYVIDFKEQWKSYYYAGGYTHHPGIYQGPPVVNFWQTHEIQQIWIRNYTDMSKPEEHIHYLLLVVLYDKEVIIGGKSLRHEVWSPTLHTKVAEVQNNLMDLSELLPELQHGLPPMPADFQYEETCLGKFFVLYAPGRRFTNLKVSFSKHQ